MEDFIEVLKRCPLFDNIAEGDLSAMLGCLKGQILAFDRGQVILSEGSPAESIGIVLEGSAQVVLNDYYGNRTIQAAAGPGELFAETFACAEVEKLPVSVEGAEPGRAMILPIQQIITTCSNACAFHSRMVMNLLHAVAVRNLILNEKLAITSRRSTREKLMAYLTAQAVRAGQREFTIPFDRQELADYLCVERSALSAEIGKLRREGVLESERSKFTLLIG